MVKYGFLHCHTQNSVKDSVMTVERLCERAKEMGAPAVALTDHGVLTGIPSLINPNPFLTLKNFNTPSRISFSSIR